MVRVWRRRLLGGLGMAAIVPAMLLASLALLAVAGGFGGLSALGQAFSGPSLPASETAGPRPGPSAGARVVPPALLAALSAPTSSPAPAGGGAGSTATGGGTTTEPGRQIFAGSNSAQQGGSGQAPRGSRSNSTPPAPKPQPTLADRVVSAGTAVTSQVPGPAGPAATKVLQAAGSTLDSIAPVKSPIKSP